MPTKYIFVTGGVVSSIGKGICVASIGRILKSQGLSVTVAKLDPYLNVDPGTMSPYQHGEVFVTKDGGETDLDLGHYERFIDVELTRDSNVTAGQAYLELITRERRGDFLGGTIQTVPHLTNEIKDRLISLAEKSEADVVIVEVGGTVGDIEGLPFLEAIRQMRNTVGRNNVFYMHLTLLPYISASEELKTKPTQHSVKELRSIGIQPDALICRSDTEITRSIQEKLSLFCDVETEAVFPMPTVGNVYEVPLIMEEFGLGSFLSQSLNLGGKRELREWYDLVNRMNSAERVVPIAIVGKYVEYPDSYMSVREALRHAAASCGLRAEVRWVHSEAVERDGPDEYLKDVCGIVVPGGFGPRGVEGMVETSRYARDKEVPYLGLCLGMQVMVIDWARDVAGLRRANSSELDPDTEHPVIDIMHGQRGITDLGGTMRLGQYPCRPQSNTQMAQAYGSGWSEINERHRHRYEVNNRYRESLEASGMVMSGLSPDGELVEAAEVPNHPFMVGVQFHPEFRSRPNRPHPLFCALMGQAGNTVREGKQLPFNRSGWWSFSTQ
ncbi:MAG: CTP synthase [Chloroflexota bacterium]|nr:CTP synthase [Chloroflexota bacterium]MDE2684556.1 CTP synthase [Chloroflexota bacterium]